jgi:hypothetical protein
VLDNASAIFYAPVSTDLGRQVAPGHWESVMMIIIYRESKLLDLSFFFWPFLKMLRAHLYGL